jgi:hypothetical protein
MTWSERDHVVSEPPDVSRAAEGDADVLLMQMESARIALRRTFEDIITTTFGRAPSTA